MLEEIKKKIEEEKENFKYMRNNTNSHSIWCRYDGIADGLSKALDIIKEVENDKKS